jgi:hypothetical protein
MSHVHFRHILSVRAELMTNPWFMAADLVEFGYLAPMQPALPAPNPLTVYSRRPLGYMAAPIPQLRRPKGYEPPQRYARPADLMISRRYMWERY